MKMPRIMIINHVLHKYEKESSKLRMSGGSWTVNVDKFPLAKYHTIRYITRQYVYDIDTKDALANGFFKNLLPPVTGPKIVLGGNKRKIKKLILLSLPFWPQLE